MHLIGPSLFVPVLLAGSSLMLCGCTIRSRRDNKAILPPLKSAESTLGDVGPGKWGPVCNAEPPSGRDHSGNRIDFSGFRARIRPQKQVYAPRERVRFVLEVQNATKETKHLYWDSTLCLSCKTHYGGRMMPGKALPNPRTKFNITEWRRSGETWELGTIAIPPGETQGFATGLGGDGTLPPGEYVLSCRYRLVPLSGTDYLEPRDSPSDGSTVPIEPRYVLKRIELLPVAVIVKE